MKVLIIVCFFIILSTNCFTDSFQGKINGVSFVSPSKEIGASSISKPKTILNSNWISLMPYGFIREGSYNIEFNHNWQWWGERDTGIVKMISLAQKEGYTILLKPHIWISKGTYTGSYSTEDELEWKELEDSYKRYILHYANIAENNKIALFCIGTEWHSFTLKRESYWVDLIREIRRVYSGKLTYASNWDEYKTVSFWKELDLIGVDAYFPVSNEKLPSVIEASNNLLEIKKDLAHLSDSLNKKILFTEYGYRSMDYSGEKPWVSEHSELFNENAQLNLLEAFYKVFWEENFIAGGFIWKWFANHDESGGVKNTGFTPQNKKAEKLIREYYN